MFGRNDSIGNKNIKGAAVQQVKEKRGDCLPVLIILPAVLLGVWAMIGGGVSPVLWGQQAAAFVLCLLIVRPMRRIVQKAGPAVPAVLLLFLAATLLGAGAGGARRWVDLGVFNVNAALLVLPALLVLLGGMQMPWLLLCASALLCIQPDFSQLIALLAASLPLLWRWRKARAVVILCAALEIVFAAICLGKPVVMEPAPYCEGVLAMLGERSALLLPVGAVSLAIIPGFWGWRFWKEKHMWMLSLAAYYAVTILFGLTGEYPVPFMGFGLSPILGCALAAAAASEAS